MVRSVSISTTLAEVTPYWEPALWVLIVVVTAGIVGSALWAPSRSGRRRGQRKLFRRNDDKARRDERSTAAAAMAAAPDMAADVEMAPAEPSSPPSVAPPVPTAQPVEPVVVEAPPEVPRPPASVIINGSASAERPLESVPQPVPVSSRVVFADVEAGFSRLASDVHTLAGQVTFFGERSTVPPEMPTWPREHQQALADGAAEALADLVDQLLEHSLAVASDVRALDRLLGGRSHDDAIGRAVADNRSDLEAERGQIGRIHHRFAVLAGDFAVLSGTADQLAKVASIVDATDAVMGSWEPLAVEVRTAAANS